MKNTLWVLPGLLAVFAGCMHDNPEKAAAQSSKVVAKLSIAAPEFARTTETKDKWLAATAVQLSMEIPVMAGMAMKASTLPSLMDTVVGGYRISAGLDSGKPLDEFMGGGWMMMSPGQSEHHMAVTLSDAGAPKDSLAPTPILGSTVVLVVIAGSTAVDSFTLMPVQGADGPSYGANVPLALDMSWNALEVHASAPLTSCHDQANQGRLAASMVGRYPSLMIMDTPTSELSIGALTLADSVMLELTMNKPETLWIWDTANRAPVAAPPVSATVFAKVRLTDLKSRGRSRIIGYSLVRCQLFTEDMGVFTGDSTLKPIHGAHGFYYGANVPVPVESSHHMM